MARNLQASSVLLRVPFGKYHHADAHFLFSLPGVGWLGCGMAEITRMLEAVQRGEPEASAELFRRVYEELRQVAGQKMAREAPGHTLQPTELVHEAWLRLAGQEQPPWHNRAHFFGAAAEAMRRILVERARRRNRLKRGGQWTRVDMEEADIPSPMPDDDLLAMDEALGRLAEFDARAAEVVKLNFFAGLTHEQAASELGLSLSTIERSWTFARAWLFREIEENRGGPQPSPETPVKGTVSQKRT
jgi:RNA polymerase sigma factor (TIGR02999 family)